MTKIYELPNGKRLIADVDEKHHTATVTVYALDDLVEAVNKAGKWLPKLEGRYIYAKCSECGEIHNIPHNYCPSCGCVMDNDDFNAYIKAESEGEE